MEQQEVVQHLSPNGIEKEAPAPVVIEPSQPATIEAKTLLDKREKMMQGLNSIKADREALNEQLSQLEESVKRTEGALIMLNTLIQELDPQALQAQQGR